MRCSLALLSGYMLEQGKSVLLKIRTVGCYYARLDSSDVVCAGRPAGWQRGGGACVGHQPGGGWRRGPRQQPILAPGEYAVPQPIMHSLEGAVASLVLPAICSFLLLKGVHTWHAY